MTRDVDFAEYLDSRQPMQFVFGAFESNGYVLTFRGGLADQSGEETYKQRLAILAALIEELEADTEHSAEEIFRDLIEKRNERREDRSDQA